MAIALDQDLGSGVFSTSGSTVSFNTAQTVAAGGFIIVTISGFGTTSSTVSGGGLTWSVDKNGSPGGGRQVMIASAQAPSGLASGTTITGTYDVSSPVRVIAGTSFTGVKTSSPVDGTPTGPTNTSSSTSWATDSYTISAGSLLFGLIYQVDNNSGNTPTGPSVEAHDLTTADPLEHVEEYRIESSAGSYTVAGTWGTAAVGTHIAVAYLAAATTPGGLPLNVTKPNFIYLRKNR